MEKKKILVIDDEIHFQSMVTDILSLADYEVVCASDGEEGLKKIYEESPDLIILDCAMPKLDGYEVLSKIKEDAFLISKPIIMLTVNDSEMDEIKGLKLGIDDYITKPFKPSTLLARMKSLLERKSFAISVNPLTLLQGNISIELEVKKRVTSDIPFSTICIDLSNFKSFNDRYGFKRGDAVIKHTAKVIVQAVQEKGTSKDFVGHIGGDDLIILTQPEKHLEIAERIIQLFDETIPDFYDLEDRKQGYIISTDRSGNIQKFPIITIGLTIVSTIYTKVTHYGQISQISADLKKIVKQYNHSAYVIERRKE